jgi:mannose-6-phosphate isomerase
MEQGLAHNDKNAAIPQHQIVQELHNWTVEKALPLWSTAGFDKSRGGFRERLNVDGSPDLSALRRLRVQARQVYVYAHAAALGWYPQGRDVALKGIEFMVRNYRSPDGRPGYVHLLTPDGQVADNLRDTYDHMFVLLALAWSERACGDAQVRGLLNETLDFVDECLTAPDGSFVEGLPATLPRRQNPHMHAFEAMLALHETNSRPDGLKRARRLLGLLEGTFFDPKTRTITEYFGQDWSSVSGSEGLSVEPGHFAEWAWLLRRHERFSDAPWGPLSTDLLESALRWADPKTGFLVDEADARGPVRRATRRAWPQTELAKAWMGEAEAGRIGAKEKALLALDALKTHYLDQPLIGGWTDQFDGAGCPISDLIPASTFYHVFCAIAEADRVLS